MCGRTRSRAPQADGGFDPAREARRRCFAWKLLLNDAAQRLDPLALGGHRRLGGKAPLDLERMGGVELAVEIGVDEQGRVVLRRSRHDRSFGSSVPMRAISRRRARASRDITVPIGTLVTSAISR